MRPVSRKSLVASEYQTTCSYGSFVRLIWCYYLLVRIARPMLCNVWNTALRSYVLSDLPFVTTAAAPRLQCKNLVSLQSPLNVTTNHYSFSEKRPVLVRAATDAGESDVEQSETPKPTVKIEEMPLESKQKMIMEQRAKMKLAKKLRQRRKRLVRKRRLRKKGRWPPSKMKKLKNV
jgi:50S ribosomal protein 5